MKKQLINFDEYKYNMSVTKLKQLVEAINNQTEFLNSKNIVITKEYIKEIAINRKKFKNKMFLIALEEVCNNFGVDFDEVKLWEYQYTHTDMFNNIANKKAKPFYQFADEIFKVGLTSYSHITDYIEIENNVASPTISALDDIREYFTYYTDNEKQNKVLDKVQQIATLLDELTKMNVDRYQTFHLIRNDFSIDEVQLHKI